MQIQYQVGRYCRNHNTLGCDPNYPLAYDMGSELCQPTMGMLLGERMPVIEREIDGQIDMYTCTVKRCMAWWKEQIYITRCTLIYSARKNGEGYQTPNQKLSLLQLVGTEEIFSKKIMRDLQENTNDRAGYIWQVIIFKCSLNGWSVSRWRHFQPKGWWGVNRIRQKTCTRYVHSEFIQLHNLSKYFQ